MALYICSPNYWTVIWTWKWTGDWLPEICIKSHCAGPENEKKGVSIYFRCMTPFMTLTSTQRCLCTHRGMVLHTFIGTLVQNCGYQVTVFHLSPCSLVPDTDCWSQCPCLALTDGFKELLFSSKRNCLRHFTLDATWLARYRFSCSVMEMDEAAKSSVL